MLNIILFIILVDIVIDLVLLYFILRNNQIIPKPTIPKIFRKQATIVEITNPIDEIYETIRNENSN